MIEKCVIGDYIVNPKRIGKGAFSSVYSGKDKFDNDVAIKKIEIDSIKKIGERIRKEIKICQTLDHVNVIKTHDVIYDKNGGNIYIITEFCSKGDLSQFLKGRAMKEKYALYFMKQIRNGLKYLIDNKIFHRDLKPHNILINEKGELKIADFGFARHFESDNMIETLCGTPLYMAPEIMKKQKYTTKSDLWSVGVILYQMLFGKRPYDAHNILDLLHNIEKNEVQIPNSFEISSEVLDLLKKLLCKDPKDRIEWEDFIEHKWFNIELEISNKQIIKNDEKEIPEEKNKILKSFYKFKNLISNKMNRKKEEEKVENKEEKNKKEKVEKDIKEKIEQNTEKQNTEKQNKYIENIKKDNSNIIESNIENDNNKSNLIINETYYSNIKTTKPIPINSNKRIHINNDLEEQDYKNITDNSPIFSKNSNSVNDFIIISNSDIKLIKKEDKENYMEKEEESDEENELGRYYSNSVKDVINNSLDYVKNSMYYFTVYKNTSL